MGIAAIEDDPDFDFDIRIHSIQEELVVLNIEATELASQINKELIALWK